MGGVDPALLQPHVNVLRLSLHPGGLASRIVNLVQWRSHLLARLRRQVEVSADPVLEELWRELSEYPLPQAAGVAPSAPAGSFGASDMNADDYAGVIVPLHLRTDEGILSFLSTTTIFGTPVDITLSEVALETFFPADARTGEALRRAAAAGTA